MTTLEDITQYQSVDFIKTVTDPEKLRRVLKEARRLQGTGLIDLNRPTPESIAHSIAANCLWRLNRLPR